MNNMNSSTVVLAFGALTLAASLLADFIGLGDDPGFGRQQTTGVIVGVVVLALGFYMHRQGDQGDQSSDSGPDDSAGP